MIFLWWRCEREVFALLIIFCISSSRFFNKNYGFLEWFQLTAGLHHTGLVEFLSSKCNELGFTNWYLDKLPVKMKFPSVFKAKIRLRLRLKSVWWMIIIEEIVTSWPSSKDNGEGDSTSVQSSPHVMGEGTVKVLLLKSWKVITKLFTIFTIQGFLYKIELRNF